jgi:hypothetical protein
MFQLATRGLKFGVVSEFKDLGGYVSAAFGSAMLVNKAPHPNATTVFLNWFLTKEGQTVWSKGMGYVSRRLDVPRITSLPTGCLNPESNIGTATTKKMPCYLRSKRKF